MPRLDRVADKQESPVVALFNSFVIKLELALLLMADKFAYLDCCCCEFSCEYSIGSDCIDVTKLPLFLYSIKLAGVLLFT